ncbi:RagB/SusD family nutrient uptake outer membrane protein [Butyricimonas faecihominis]|uniref:RagB/SusD family nutrient uptake outer membrane protein n=1 Tax=Butyricimonas faecihominis TaxID=1472416 RepID=UPI0032C102F3
MRKTIIILTILAGGLFFGGCNSWLDVKPYDSMAEDQLYSTENGIQRALNGLYLSLASNDLYAENLGGGAIDVLGQRYKLSSGHTYYDLNEYNYTNDGPKGTFEAIWKAAYKLIADCNEFLEKVPEHQDLMSQANYRMSMGEALAIRTLLHFDMFRIFGPVYSEANKKESSIPYYNMVTDVTQPILPADELVEHLFADIDSAIVLLSEDVILTEGIVKDEDFWDYRNLRLNYYAVWALKARMCWYLGDEYADEAYRIATTLLEGKDPKTNEANNFNTAFTPVSQTVAVKDRVFFCEELFALHNMKRTTMYKELFSSDLEDDNILLSTESYINKLYDEPNDYRKHSWEVATGRQTSGLMVFVKYAEQTENRSDPYLYEIQSMLRLSELYLIAAATTNDDAVASSWLEKLRMIRGYQSGMVGSDVQTTLRQEWEKEFYGEGQYYYYLKCNGITSVSGPNGSKKPNYIIPLPESETDNRRD